MLKHIQEFAVAWRGHRLAALSRDVSPFLRVPERRRTLGFAKERFIRPLGKFRISGPGASDVVLRGFNESWMRLRTVNLARKDVFVNASASILPESEKENTHVR